MTDRVAAVTGATGFLGARLCQRLLEDGWTVRGFRRPSTGRGHLGDRIDWSVGELLDDHVLGEFVDGADAVFHLAGLDRRGVGRERYERATVDGTQAVLAACRRRSVGRLVFVTTAATRRPSAADDVPDRRDAANEVATPGDVTTEVADETDVAKPNDAYGAAAAEAELHVDRYASIDGDAVTVHPASVFGPGDDGFTADLLAMATSPTRVVHRPGGCSIVGVADVVDGLVSAADRGESGEHYILGGENLTYEDAVSRIADAVGGRSLGIRVPSAAVRVAGSVATAVGSAGGRRFRPLASRASAFDADRRYYSSRKAHEELGYTFDPIEEHVPAAMSWYRSR